MLLGIRAQRHLIAALQRSSWGTHARLSCRWHVSHGKSPRRIRANVCRRPTRDFIRPLEASSAIFLPPLVLTGLVVALWTWKCVMMVVFQNKIIYMPGMPPGTRGEEIGDYVRECSGVRWQEVHIRSMDGTRLVLAVASPPPPPPETSTPPPTEHVYILYLQGNVASTPPRLPVLSAVLRSVRDSSAAVGHTMIAVAYRGYWKSGGRASEPGIDQDVMAAMQWVLDTHAANYGHGSATRPVVVVWGHSIGAGFATNLAAKAAGATAVDDAAHLKIDSLILETPFASIRAMLEDLYPQKWLPYRYLWPFLRNHLNSLENLARVAEANHKPNILMVVAEKDELVPFRQSSTLRELCESLNLDVEYKTVPGAFHNEASLRADGRKAITSFLVQQSLKRD